MLKNKELLKKGLAGFEHHELPMVLRMIAQQCRPMPVSQMARVLAEIVDERNRQDAKWGGVRHDDKHSPFEWVQWMRDYLAWARMMYSMDNAQKYRKRLLHVVALGVAAMCSHDRRTGDAYVDHS